jgi:hypothetical protein
MVVGMGCAHGTRDLGLIFRVPEVVTEDTHCEICDLRHGTQPCAVDPRDDDLAFPLTWLKRIPPLDELEGEKTKEELHA